MTAALDPFDASLAESLTRVLPLALVVDPLGPVPHAAACVESYRAAMARGDRFPPIAVVPWGRRYLVADGHKRLAAYHALGPSHVRVEVWTWRH